jgi:hypothetical protein
MSAAASLDSLVRAAWLRARAARALEATLLGVSAALATAGAAQLSGVEPLRGDVLAVSGLAACACAATWWVEHAPQRSAIALRIDAALGMRGAFTTAWEHEARGGALAALLVERTQRALPPDVLARASRGPALALAALPLACAAVLLALPAARPATSVALRDLLPRVAAALVRASQSSTTSPDSARQLAASAEELLESSSNVAQLERELGMALRALESARAGADATSEPVQVVATDLVRAALAELGSGDGAGASVASRGGFSQAQAASGMQNGPAVPTMSGSPEPARTSGTPASPVPPAAPLSPAPEAGTSAGRWWRREDDGVVSAWRARAADTQR